MADPHDLSDHLSDLLAHLIRAAILADDDAVAARLEAFRVHETVRVELDDADLAAIHLDGLWSIAKGKVQNPDLTYHPLLVSRQLAAACPVSLGDLVGPSLATGKIEERIRSAAATG